MNLWNKLLRPVILIGLFFIVYLFDIYTSNRYIIVMIISFADKETNKVFQQVYSRRLPHDIQRVALRKLIMIDCAGCLDDLRVPPANRLEALKGNRQGQYSIRINDQYRICFYSTEFGFENVEIIDYHSWMKGVRWTHKLKHQKSVKYWWKSSWNLWTFLHIN